MPPFRAQRGQASVELVALVPFVVLAIAIAWQAVVAGQAIWLAGSAARKAARAHAVGDDARGAARSVLPGTLADRLTVRANDEGRVRIEIDVPIVIGGERLTTIDAEAHFEPQGSQ